MAFFPQGASTSDCLLIGLLHILVCIFMAWCLAIAIPSMYSWQRLLAATYKSMHGGVVNMKSFQLHSVHYTVRVQPCIYMNQDS